MFRSPHAVPPHGEGRQAILQRLRLQMMSNCEGCLHLQDGDAAQGFCRAWNALLSPETSFWRACAMHSRFHG